MDFSFWNELVRLVCNTTPKNRDEPVERIKERWDVLKPDYVSKTCGVAWDRLLCVIGPHIEDVPEHQGDEEEGEDCLIRLMLCSKLPYDTHAV